MKESWIKLNEWWSVLAPREKQIVGLGSVFVVFFIVYQWIWTPYLGLVSNMREKLLSGRKTLSWIQAAEDTIQKLEKQAGRSSKGSKINLLGQIQKRINQAGLEQYLVQLKQGANHSIEMRFQQVEFDRLIALIINLMKQEHLSVTQLSVSASRRKAGLVEAEIEVQAG